MLTFRPKCHWQGEQRKDQLIRFLFIYLTKKRLFFSEERVCLSKKAKRCIAPDLIDFACMTKVELHV